MPRSVFVDGLLKQDPKALAQQIVLWDKFKVWTLAAKKIEGFLNEKDEVSHLVEEETAHILILFGDKPGVMRASFLTRICEHLSICIDVKTSGDLHDLGMEIEKKTIQLQSTISKGKFKGENINDLVSFNLKKMFDDLGKQYDHMDETKKKDFIQKIIQSIDEMSEDQRNIVRKELGVDKITEAAITKAIAAGTLGIAFAAVVEIAGFSAYIFAVKVLAGVAALVGITLPFAVYTTLTSVIAAAANPFLLIPVICGLGYYLGKRANNKIRSSLLPILIVQSVVSSSKEGSIDEQEKKLVDEFG